MSSEKKQVRERFRSAVLKRDGNRCRACGAKGELDAHHVTDRNEFENGGYVLENGIALCPICHEKAEEWHKSGGASFVAGYRPEDLYGLIGSSLEKAIEADKN